MSKKIPSGRIISLLSVTITTASIAGYNGKTCYIAPV